MPIHEAVCRHYLWLSASSPGFESNCKVCKSHLTGGCAEEKVLEAPTVLPVPQEWGLWVRQRNRESSPRQRKVNSKTFGRNNENMNLTVYHRIAQITPTQLQVHVSNDLRISFRSACLIISIIQRRVLDSYLESEGNKSAPPGELYLRLPIKLSHVGY